MFSGLLAVLAILLLFNIIKVDDAAKAMHLSPTQTEAFRSLVVRVQEITGGLLDLLTKALKEISGMDLDLRKVFFEAGKAATDPNNIFHQPPSGPTSNPPSHP